VQVKFVLPNEAWAARYSNSHFRQNCFRWMTIQRLGAADDHTALHAVGACVRLEHQSSQNENGWNEAAPLNWIVDPGRVDQSGLVHMG
jgi:hypothetical protein